MKVLLVPADFHRAEGTIAKEIISGCPDIDFFFFPAHGIRRREEEFLDILSRVDVVHWLMNFCNIKLPEGLSPANLPCPSVATVHHVCQAEEIKVDYARKADAIHVVSKEWLDWFAPEKELSVVLAHNGVNLKTFSSNRTVKRPHIPFRFGIFGFYQSLTNRKRLDLLIEALCSLKRRDLTFELVVQGVLHRDVRMALSHAQFSVREIGVVPVREAWKGYREIDCYVCSSDVEGSPFPVLEALASGVPVVSTSTGIAKEVLPFGGGILLPVNDPVSLSTALTKMIADPAFYQECAQKAPEAAARFSWQTVGREYVQLYKTAIENWEKKRGESWKGLNHFKLSPISQRRRELSLDLLEESAFLQRSGKNLSSISTCVRGLSSGDVSFKSGIIALSKRLREVFLAANSNKL